MKSLLKKIVRRIPPIKRLMKYQTKWEPGHYYSAIPDKQTGLERTTKAQLSSQMLSGINLNEDNQLLLMDELVSLMKTSTFRNEEKDDQHRFFNKNGIYGYSDALILESMIRYLKPSRIVEAGSGFSSALMLDVNEKYFDYKINLEFIEPYPARLKTLLKEKDEERALLRIQGLQSVDLSVFKSLEKNDILFIDSTHVAKTGSDLLYLFFEVLPVLNSGVYIHFHDIFNNFEYLPDHFNWAPGFAWNESYFLRSFLMYNDQFEVVLFSNFLDSKHRDRIAEKMADYPFLTGAQFWMRKL